MNTNDTNNFLKESRFYISEYNLACLFYGYKTVMKQPIDIRNLSKLDEILKNLNLVYVLSDFFYFNPNEGCEEKNTHKIIYISKDTQYANEAKRIDCIFNSEFYVDFTPSIVDYSIDEVNQIMWKLLWYPDCCVRSFNWYDWPDWVLFDIFSKRMDTPQDCHNFLNQFELQILHHIPCSFNCQKSIDLWEKLFPLFIDSYDPFKKEQIKKDILCEKTYVFFSSTGWIKMVDGKYVFGSNLNKPDPLYDKVKFLIEKCGFHITILSSNEIEVVQWEKKVVVQKIKVFHFPETE